MIFLGTPHIAAEILDYIIEKKQINIDAVWTNSAKKIGRGKKSEKKQGVINQGEKNFFTPTPVSIIAKKHNILCYECDKITLEDEIKAKEISSDMMFIVAFGKILPESFFSIPKLGSFNLHFSCLPKYRGASPIQSAILHEETHTGITFQKINNKMDAGDIVLQERFSLERLNSGEAMTKALEVSKNKFDEFLFKVKKKQFITQDHQEATYCKKIKKEDGKIKSNIISKKLIHQYLAYVNWPGIFFVHQKTRYNIIKINLNYIPQKNCNEEDFILLQRQGKKIFLQLQDGLVEILILQRQGRKALPVSDFLNGCAISFPITIRE